MKKIVFLLLLLSSRLLPLYGQGLKEKDERCIRAVMREQEAAWNGHDLAGFMKGYWESDTLMFIGSRGLTYGWAQTLANYQKSYGNAEKMGTLRFEIEVVRALGKNHALVIGQWFLEREESGDVGGWFSLTWEKRKGGWVIIADHSS